MNPVWLLFVLAFGADCVVGQAQTAAQQVPPNCVCDANTGNNNNNGRGGKQMCRSDNGQVITNHCQFTNELALNQNLGVRPCNQTTTGTNGFNNQCTVCLTNGQPFTGTQSQLQTLLNTSPGLGIRCKTACPCTLTCSGGRGQGGRGGANGFGGRGR